MSHGSSMKDCARATSSTEAGTVARILHGQELQDGTGVIGLNSWSCCHSGLISENPELALKETWPVMTDVVA